MGTPSSVAPLKGCLVFLGVFVVSALAIGLAAYLFVPAGARAAMGPVALYAGVIGGFFLALGLMSLSEAVRRVRETRLLRESAAGTPPADGARIAACGVLVADGPQVEAPFSGTRSAIYKYAVMTRHQKSDSEICSGYFLTPCHVETAAGPVRILGYAEPAFAAARPGGPDVVARAQAYFASASITPTGLGALREFNEMLADDDGAIRKDTGVVPSELTNPRLYFVEHAVAGGESVCAFGHYSSERVGLVPDPASVDPYAVSLRRGDAGAVRRSLLRAAAGQLFGFLLLAALAGGAVFVVALMFSEG